MDLSAREAFEAAGGSGEVLSVGQIQIRHLRDGAAEGQTGAFDLKSS